MTVPLNLNTPDLSQLYPSVPMQSPVLQDYVNAISNLMGGIQNNIAGLYNLVNPYTCPDIYLPNLAALIGLNPRVLSYRYNAVNYSGNIYIDTTLYAWGGSSTFFNQNGYLSIIPSNSLNFQGGTFTIENLTSFTSISGTQNLITLYQDSNNYVQFYYTNNQLIFNFAVAGTVYPCVVAQFNPVVGTWYNLAVEENLGSYTIYINGNSINTGIQGQNIPLLNGNLYIGQNGAGANFFNGHMQELRISNIARYSANYVPIQTQFNSDINTILLLHLNGYTQGSTSFSDISYAYWQRLQLINAISFYEIKGTNEAIQYLAYFLGLNIQLQYFWTDSAAHYNSGTFTPESWFYDLTRSSFPSNLNSSYFLTPHYGLYILLTQPHPLSISLAINSIQLLVIAGGGGGGFNGGGGGGAGGLIYNASYAITSMSSLSVTVGTGGLGGVGGPPWPANGVAGNNSVFNDQTAIGGGYGGGSQMGLANSEPGGNGGSGGGGGGQSAGHAYPGGSGTGGQGNNGGAAQGGAPFYYGGGGGGAGGVGVGGSSNGTGGPGLSYSISGSSVTYAVGGTAGSANGAGTSSSTYGSGGFGGGNETNGGSGVNGVVIVSYPTPSTGDGSGGTITHVGGNTIHTFTSNGSFTPPIGNVYYLWNDTIFPDLQYFTNLNNPAHCVPHYFLNLAITAKESGGVVVSPGNVYAATENWSFSTNYWDSGIPLQHYDSGYNYDTSYSAFISSITTWKLGTGNVTNINPPSGGIATPVLSGSITSLTMNVTNNVWTITLPKGTILNKVTEFALYSGSTPVVIAYFPAISTNSGNIESLNIVVTINKQ